MPCFHPKVAQPHCPPPDFWDLPRAHGMSFNNQILHGDQTRCEDNFYTVDLECWRAICLRWLTFLKYRIAQMFYEFFSSNYSIEVSFYMLITLLQVILGGGRRNFQPNGSSSDYGGLRLDGRDLIQANMSLVSVVALETSTSPRMCSDNGTRNLAVSYCLHCTLG